MYAFVELNSIYGHVKKMLQNFANNKVSEARISVKTGRKDSIEAVLYYTSIMRERSRAERAGDEAPEWDSFPYLVEGFYSSFTT